MRVRRAEEGPPLFLREDTAAAVTRELLGPAPQAAALRVRLEQDLGLSPGAARRLLYEVTRRVNGGLFHPITMLELILTERCSLRCDYCFEGRIATRRDMPAAVGRGAIDLLLDYSGEADSVWITHFGGEPTLRFTLVRELTEYAEREGAARGKAVRFSMTSNGVGLTEAMAEYFTEHGVRVLLSLDGLGQTHDRHRVDRRGGGSFARARRALERLKRTQGWVGAKMTVMPDAVDRLVADVAGLHALGVNQFLIGAATGVSWPRPAAEAYAAAWRRLRDWYAGRPRGEIRIDELEAESCRDRAGMFGCRAGRTSIAVAPDGRVSACAKILALDSRRLLAPLGDVDSGLTHLANRTALVGCAALRARCAELGVADRYHGCFATNHEATGDLFAPDLDRLRFEERVREAISG